MTRALLTTDGSAGALHAAATGSRILGADAELILLHVVPAMPVMPAAGRFAAGAMEPTQMETTEEGRAILRRAADALDVEAEHLVVEGEPAATICDVAAERHVDVIVVGMRGVGPVRRALLGSVSDQVTREAELPVLVVPAPEAGD